MASKELSKLIYKQKMDGKKLERHPCRAINTNNKPCLNNSTSATFYLCGLHKKATVRFTLQEYKEVLRDMQQSKIAAAQSKQQERIAAGFAAMSYDALKTKLATPDTAQ